MCDRRRFDQLSTTEQIDALEELEISNRPTRHQNALLRYTMQSLILAVIVAFEKIRDLEAQQKLSKPKT